MKFSRLKQFVKWILSLANHDFCPQVNPYVYWLKKPVVWVVAAIIFSLLVGLMIGPQGYVMAIAFLTLLLLGLVWPWLSMRGIRCQLILPDDRMWENRNVNMIFRVQNFWPLPIIGMMVEGDFLQELSPGEERIAFSLKRVPAWCETEYQISITPQQRGRLPSGEVRIKNGFPFGLIDISRPVSRSGASLVWPACESLDGHPPARGTPFNVLGALQDQSGNDGETIGVRDYRHGDRLRNIHWAQTVRSRRLMVRERQTHCATAATVLLDLSPGHHAGQGVNSSFEWAIRIAATVCYQLHGARSPVRLHCVGLADDKPRVTDNNYGIRKIMDFLACLPTFAEAQESGRQTKVNSSNEPSPSLVGRTFFIGTCRSKSVSRLSGDIDPIVIKLSGFLTEEGMTNLVTEQLPVNSGILVTTPQLAASQLDREWRRSFHGATC